MTRQTLPYNYICTKVNTKKLDTPVGQHFNLPNHSITDMILQGIESLGTRPDTVRASREKMWMTRLRTIQPHGLKKETTNSYFLFQQFSLLISRPIYSFLLSCFYLEFVFVPYLLFPPPYIMCCFSFHFTYC